MLLDLSHERQFLRYDKVPDQVDGGKPWPQGGLMGLALHPQLLQGQPYVYLAYLYRFAGANQPGKGGKLNYGGYFFTTRLVRYALAYYYCIQQYAKWLSALRLLLPYTFPANLRTRGGW